MVVSAPATTSEVIELAKSYGELVIEGISGRNDPESIESGISGDLIFLMELYRHTGEELYLAEVDAALERLVAYCRKTPVFNYSLFTGRGGVVYALIMRHTLGGNGEHLRTAVELMLPASLLFLQSRYTSDYLYDGRAGALLIFVELHRLSGDDALVEPISEFVNAILGNALISREGISWKGEEELGLGGCCGLAYGVAGIGYALRKVKRYSNNSGLDYILAGVKAYLDACWNPSEGTWMHYRKDIDSKADLDLCLAASRAKETAFFRGSPSLSWANGAAGIVLAGWGDPDARERAAADNILRYLGSLGPDNMDIFDGGAGMVAALWAFPNENATAAIKELRTRMIRRFQGLTSFEPGGLLRGKTGELYFLLVSQRHGGLSDTLFLPFAGGLDEEAGRRITISVSPAKVRKQLYRQLYPRLVDMLDSINLTVSQPFWDVAEPVFSGSETGDFAEFAKRAIGQLPVGRMREPLMDLLALESAKIGYLETHSTSSLEIHLDEVGRHERAMAELNKPDEWLLRQKFFLSPGNGFFVSKWNWSLTAEGSILDEDQMRALHPLNLNLPAGEFEYIFSMSNRIEERETCFTAAFRALLHCFDTPCSPLDAIVKVKSYMRSLPEEMLRTLLDELKISRDYQTKEFLSLLDKEIFSTIKKWIYRGIIIA